MAAENGQEAWVRLPSEEEFKERFGDGTHPYQIHMGGVAPRMGRLIMAHDVIGQALGALSATVLFGPGALSRAEREMVAAVTAAAQDCAY